MLKELSKDTSHCLMNIYIPSVLSRQVMNLFQIKTVKAGINGLLLITYKIRRGFWRIISE